MTDIINYMYRNISEASISISMFCKNRSNFVLVSSVICINMSFVIN